MYKDLLPEIPNHVYATLSGFYEPGVMSQADYSPTSLTDGEFKALSDLISKPMINRGAFYDMNVGPSAGTLSGADYNLEDAGPGVDQLINGPENDVPVFKPEVFSGTVGQLPVSQDGGPSTPPVSAPPKREPIKPPPLPPPPPGTIQSGPMAGLAPLPANFGLQPHEMGAQNAQGDVSPPGSIELPEMSAEALAANGATGLDAAGNMMLPNAALNAVSMPPAGGMGDMGGGI